jgi:hypothetical protein
VVLPHQGAAVGPATTVLLNPPAATNPIGTQHCVTATVLDATAPPVSGISVLLTAFGVTPDGAGTISTTNASGQVVFCYTNQAGLAGIDIIQAIADANGNGLYEFGFDPTAEATKVWTVPATAPGQITGGGAVGHLAFSLNARSDGTRATGNCSIVIGPAGRPAPQWGGSLQFRCQSVDAIVITGTHAMIFGTISGEGCTAPYRIDVDDFGPGPNDLFVITSGCTQTAISGQIQIHQ